MLPTRLSCRARNIAHFLWTYKHHVDGADNLLVIKTHGEQGLKSTKLVKNVHTYNIILL